jgi:type II secretory pathway component GspD/PulD (secretin)
MGSHVRLTVALSAVALLGCLRAAAQEEDTVLIVRKGQPVSEFLDGAAAMIGRPILYDSSSQRINSQTMTNDLRWGVPKGREIDLIRSILAFHEITLVPAGPKGREVFLAIDSRSTNNLVKNKAEFVPYDQLEHYADRDGLYIMTTIPVKNVENLTILRTALSTMVTPAGIGRVHEVSRAVVVLDFAPTVVAMARLVREIDVAAEPVATATILLAHAPAAPLAATLKELFVTEVPKGANVPLTFPPAVRIAAYVATNAVVVVATERDLARIREVIKQLDVPPAEE